MDKLRLTPANKEGEIVEVPFRIAYDKPVPEEQVLNDIMEFSMNNVLNMLEDDPQARETMRKVMDGMEPKPQDTKKRRFTVNDDAPKVLQDLVDFVTESPDNFYKFNRYWASVCQHIEAWHMTVGLLKRITNRN